MQSSELCAVVGNIDPDAYGAGTVTSGWIAAKDFHNFMAIVQVGEMQASSTVDAKLEQATTSGGAGAKDVTNAAITQLTQAGTDSDKQAVINLRQEDLDVANGFDYFRLSITTAAAASDSGGIVLGLNPRQGPASDLDASTVDEIVTP